MNRIKSKRIDKKLTQNEVAEFCGVDRTSVAKWEDSSVFPRIVNLKKLAELFGCSLSELVENWS